MGLFWGYFGIVVALALFIILVYKGWRNYYIAPICVLIVCLFNQLNPLEQILGAYWNGILEMLTNCFTVIFLGAIFGRVYSDTGGTISLAKWLSKVFVDHKTGNKKILAAILVFFAISSIVIIGGIDCYAAFFTLFPIAVIFAAKANIPRRFLPGMLYLNCAFFCCPGVPLIYNIITKAAFGSVGYEYSVWAAPVPGLVAMVVIAVGSICTLYAMVKKAKAKGEVFEYGEVEHFEIKEDRPLPHPIIAVLPLILVFVLFSIVQLDIFVALTCGILLALILMGRFIERPEGMKKFVVKAIKHTLNVGADDFPGALFSVSIANGLAGVITGTAAFGALVGWIGGFNMNPLILTIIVVCIVVAITSSPPAALFVGIPVVVGILESKGASVDPNAIGRVAALASATFETLPINGAILLTMSLAKVSHKEGYMPEFMESVVFELVGTFVCAALLILFPVLS